MYYVLRSLAHTLKELHHHFLWSRKSALEAIIDEPSGGMLSNFAQRYVQQNDVL